MYNSILVLLNIKTLLILITILVILIVICSKVFNVNKSILGFSKHKIPKKLDFLLELNQKKLCKVLVI